MKYVKRLISIYTIIYISSACSPPMMNNAGSFNWGFLATAPTTQLEKSFVLTDQDPNAVDMLFVVDNSVSMGPYQTALANSFNSFIQQFSTSGINFQLGVVTSSVSTSGTNGDGEYYVGIENNMYTSNGTTCPTSFTGAVCNSNGFVFDTGHNNTGNLLIRGNALSVLPAGQHFFSNSTPNLNTLFTEVVTGVGLTGNSAETVLKSAIKTLDTNKISSTGWNKNFIRNKAAFVLFLLTDEDEADNATTGGPYDSPIQTTCVKWNSAGTSCTQYANTSQFTTRCLEKDAQNVCTKWNNEGPFTSVNPPAGAPERLPKIALDTRTKIESVKPNGRFYTRYLINKSKLQTKITTENNIYPRYVNNAGGTPMLLGISASESSLLKGPIIDICEKDSAGNCKDYGQQLIDSANSIISSIQNVYSLDLQPVAPSNKDKFKVYINDQLVPQDPNNGWTYKDDGYTVVLHGSYAPPAISGTMKVVYEAYKPN